MKRSFIQYLAKHHPCVQFPIAVSWPVHKSHKMIPLKCAYSLDKFILVCKGSFTLWSLAI